MSVLVIAEHDNAVLKAATLNAIGAAAKLGADIHVLVIGYECQAVAQQAASVDGVQLVKLADAPHYGDLTAENHALLIVEQARAYSHIIAPATSYGKNVLPRVAALLDVAQLSDVVAITAADTFVRPVYAGNALATYQSADAIKVMTIRTTNFPAANPTGGSAEIVGAAITPDLMRSKLVARELVKSARPELGDARIVVSGGRGLGSGENYAKLLEPLADKLNAALGASRAAVDAGYVANDMQIGQTGKIVAPRLYIAVGISGAIQHLAGMKDAGVIVAINKDPDAPIFQLADYGLVGDLFVTVPELTAAL